MRPASNDTPTPAPASGLRRLLFGWVVLLLAAWSLRAATVSAGSEVFAGAESLGSSLGFEGPEPPRSSEIHRALALIEYVIGDYPDAVSGEGRILDEAEYEEQREILSQVRQILAAEPSLVSPVGGPNPRQRADLLLLRDLAGAQRLVARHAPSLEVQDALRALWRDLVEVSDLRLTPPQTPDLLLGARLYQRACAVCHGADGRGLTETALRLEPPPRDWMDMRYDDTLSPARVYNAIGFGIPGTAMPAFEVMQESERWDLAFYVLALRQSEGSRVSPCVAVSAEAATMVPTADELAGMSDAALAYWLREAGVPEDCVDAVRTRIRQNIEP